MKIALLIAGIFLSTQCLAKTPAEIAAETINETQRAIKAETIRAETAKGSNFTLFITYPIGPTVRPAQAKRDTELVARTILKKLVTEGRKPGMDDLVFIHVHAIQRAKGETREGFIDVGNAVYNFNSDRIEFTLD